MITEKGTQQKKEREKELERKRFSVLSMSPDKETEASYQHHGQLRCRLIIAIKKVFPGLFKKKKKFVT